MTSIDRTLAKLEQLIRENRFEQMETDSIELKPVPPTGGDWKERKKSVCAFLNTRGGVLILGIKETGHENNKRYEVPGWSADYEENVRKFATSFTDRAGTVVDLNEYLPPPIVKEVLGKQVAVIYVDELPDDLKYVFFDRVAYRRHLTGDVRITESDIEAQEEYRSEASHARELSLVPGLAISDLEIDKLNEYIHFLNQRTKVETIKPDLSAAESFLKRKMFIRDDKVTILGALVCSRFPGDCLGFRCHVHGFVDVPQQVAKDKQDYIDNILPLMEKSLAYVLRNIQVGVTVEGGGSRAPQYPEELLRETVNNALAHRDYSIDKQIIITIKPGRFVSIRNPGSFRSHLLINESGHSIPLLRVIPEARARNPKLADVLRVFNKWEGKGIGMATLVNQCLENRIDLPYFRLYSEEVALFLPAGKLLDPDMERFFQSFDGYLESKLYSKQPSESQKLVLAYLIKSELSNLNHQHTILLTPDNNHYSEIAGLESAGLIRRHEKSSDTYPIFVVDRALVETDYTKSLRSFYGELFDILEAFSKDCLNIVWRFDRFSRAKYVSAKQAAFVLWYDQHQQDDIAAFDAFYRKTRRTFNTLEKQGFVTRIVAETRNGNRTKGYRLNQEFKGSHLSNVANP